MSNKQQHRRRREGRSTFGLYLLNGDLARLILNEVPISFCSDRRFLQAKMWDPSRVHNTGLVLRQGRGGSKSRASLPGSAELSRPR
jgi:hypothetical protein